METTTIQETGLVLDYKEMPAFKGAKERQQTLLQKYEFVAIVDSKTYELAKQYRTALRQGRYELQNGEKAIAAKLNDFRQVVKLETENLINITLSAETKQQAEIERFEEEKEREKQEYLRKEQDRKNALRSQIFGFRDSKSAAISTASVKTIESIISDIESAELQVEEFTDDFISVKHELLTNAKRKQTQLVEDERLRAERKAQEEERKRLEEERQNLEALKREQESALRKQREEEEARFKAEREAQEAKLRKEREEFEAQKAAQAKIEEERKRQHEAEERTKREFELANRIKRVVSIGFEYDETEKEFFFGNTVIEQWEIEKGDDTTFDTVTIPHFKTIYKAEKDRIEQIKPDKVKLQQIMDAFSPEEYTAVLSTEKANALMQMFLNELENLKIKYQGLINEL